MKSTLKRELNSTWNCWKGSACDQTWARRIIRRSRRCTPPAQASISSARGIKASGMWLLRECYSPVRNTLRGLRSAHLQGCWRNGHQRPVLKHGPRSQSSMRVFGCQTPTRNESERRWELRRIIDRSWCSRMDLSKSIWGSDPKEGELCLYRVKPEETLVEARSGSDVQIDRQIWAWGRKTNRTF